MIISKLIKPTLQEFEDLVVNTTKALNDDAIGRSDYYRSRDGRKLEQDVKTVMDKIAIGTPFEGSIELIGGQKFPDVVVTHYPRYRINMELPMGETIFDKMGIEYDVMRNLPNPIAPIVTYYKNGLKDGESLWWIDNVETEQLPPVPMTLRLWKTLSQDERKKLIVKGMVYFPEIFSNSPKKYDRFTLWLVKTQSVISTSMRDSFTAGGKVSISTKYGFYKDLPQIYERVNLLKDEIRTEIENVDKIMLTEYWGITGRSYAHEMDEWINKVSKYSELEQDKILVLLQGIFDI